jgi:hypothetical protein
MAGMNVWQVAVIGFVVFTVGGAARAYMDFTVNGWRMFYDFRRGNTERTYKSLIDRSGGNRWPLIVSYVCIPLGIAIVFGSIILSNHLKAN